MHELYAENQEMLHAFSISVIVSSETNEVLLDTELVD